MKAYRHSVRLKLGLVVLAVLISVVSLAYTSRTVDRLREREQFVIHLWAAAQERLSATRENPYLPVFTEIEHQLVDAAVPDGPISPEALARYRSALAWSRTMPPAEDVTLAGEIILQGGFGIPAIVMDSTQSMPVIWQHVPVPDSLQLQELSPEERSEVLRRLNERARAMAQDYEPIAIEFGTPPEAVRQYLFYDDSRLIRELTIFPFLQLLFVAFFILIGYLGFSYVRRSEQSSLWVGMAREAAHQLGTPISSLMGWVELLRGNALSGEQKQGALREMERDVARLERVTARFSDIGSMPRLEVDAVAPVIEAAADYVRKRIPQGDGFVELNVQISGALYAPLNAELFEWVIENLLKNALDAMEMTGGVIDVQVSGVQESIRIDIRDTGKGIDRKNWKNIFRPGYSTKKRGWGLGLNLAKRIVEEHHGGSLVLLQSRPDQGSTFRITVPAAKKP
ncbi:MAG: two-component sensor histidine kinase [Bacteroidetes bacterium SB0662_bin_6]|nr:two-component sensor histidine kinase [Bacteroidetes bacterium SB0668_bin_1]MYE03806.1 two-component sensor histidine kinase [Bacteroidetes bacterium SB0662_bin_6]